MTIQLPTQLPGKRPQARRSLDPQHFRMEAKADAADLFLYGVVSPWDLAADLIGPKIQALEADTIHAHLNSPEGDVFDGAAIYNALVRHSARVEISIEGEASSVMSVIAMAGDEIRMGAGSTLMIHNPWTFAGGDEHDMRKIAEVLGLIKRDIVSIYEARSGIGADELVLLMDEETWYNADDAIEAGLVDAKFGLKQKPESSTAPENRNTLAVCRLFAANEQPPQSKRDFETLLRDVGGFSRKEAKRLASHFNQADDHRDDEAACPTQNYLQPMGQTDRQWIAQDRWRVLPGEYLRILPADYRLDDSRGIRGNTQPAPSTRDASHGSPIRAGPARSPGFSPAANRSSPPRLQSSLCHDDHRLRLTPRHPAPPPLRAATNESIAFRRSTGAFSMPPHDLSV